MDIDKALSNFNEKKSQVDTTMARIEQYEYAIAHPEVRENYFNITSREMGMPGAPLRDTSSPVERELTEKELTEEILREWINEDKSRIFMIKLEIEQITIAVNSLPEQEKSIIQWKYFDGLFWREIENRYNEKFKRYVGEERLKRIRKETLRKLERILEPFYKQLKTA